MKRLDKFNQIQRGLVRQLLFRVYKLLVIFAMLSMMPPQAMAQSKLDSIADILANAPVQEKVYLHLDNTCYFKGDTIWYKSYVVRADDLSYTDMSRILYVELLSPDGLVVERQNIIVSADGYGDGNFVLSDSLYSGYYELRAYTRWMLNFCVTEHSFNRKDWEQFYNRQMAKDFFRLFGTPYSRVVPVYERPESEGDYAQKYIVNRPKARLDKEQKERLKVDFYPEGGLLISGTRCRVAFEAMNEEGRLVDLNGTLEVGGKTVGVSTIHQGRGLLTIDVPENGRMRTHFNYQGKDYTFDLPHAVRTGCAVLVNALDEALSVDVTVKGVQRPLGLAVLCRGVLKHFQTIQGSGKITLDKTKLPTGVNDLIIFDEEGNPLADRLFFVNHYDCDRLSVTVSGMEDEYQPFAPISLQFEAPADTKHISISVRDGSTDDPSYDTGNIMTDLLLSSDLKGFVAHPDYYFESDDNTHRQALDLLMMVQGWRRYDYAELTDGKPLRYQPEQTMTVEGAVYKTVNFDEVRDCEVEYWLRGVFGYCPDDKDHMDPNDPAYQKYVEGLNTESGANPDGLSQQEEIGGVEQAEDLKSADDPHYGVDHRGLRHEVTLEGELVLGTEVATVQMETTNGGHFVFNVPPYYGDAILFLSAHKTDISEKKQNRLMTHGRLDENEWPEFYVKRDLFYPVFARKYDYYQCHPEEENPSLFNSTNYSSDTTRISKFDKQLEEVEVNARRRRGRHAIDYTKPVYVNDAYELYNLVTDYGLSYGKLNFRRFPKQVSMLLLGNYNSYRTFNVEARMSDNQYSPYVFYRSFKPSETIDTTPFRSSFSVSHNLHLNRQHKIRLFTDFELRNEEKPVEQIIDMADVTLDFVLMPDEAKRYTYRDRRIVLHGLYEPDDFYHPDYSHHAMPAADYRRTLYWNPNAALDSDGRFSTTFYNNGKPTRIRVSTAGIFPSSRL